MDLFHSNNDVFISDWEMILSKTNTKTKTKTKTKMKIVGDDDRCIMIKSIIKVLKKKKREANISY